MAESVTRPTDVPVETFLSTVEPARRRDEGERLVEIFSSETGEEPVMWGPSIVGFGTYHYRYDSGREGDMPRVGFSPRKAKLSLYGLTDAPGHEELLARLGPHSLGASCLYVTRLDAVDDDVLRSLVRLGYAHVGDDEVTS
ncbi:DUF1801 domain-containing protein [Demequina sp. NBRC 110057]|uniref:DUF1801 domain-containing protein n=1 Tax=Demequina sp. NBRC 110057 TaxID=1570346 RepID=UPI000A031245|nr:DUF1801 domain-containing protein [Demequina sp. NBRC 110057]